MTICLGKSCSFGLPRVPFVNCCQFFVFSYFSFGFECRMWDLIVLVSDHCLSIYFSQVNKLFHMCSTLFTGVQLVLLMHDTLHTCTSNFTLTRPISNTHLACHM